MFVAVKLTAQTFNYERAWSTYLGGVDSNAEKLFFDNQNNIYLEGTTWNFSNQTSSPPASYYNQFVSIGMQSFTLGVTNNYSAKITQGATSLLSYNYNTNTRKVIYREKNGNYFQLESSTLPQSVSSGAWLSNNVEPGNNFITLSKYNVSNVLQWKTYVPFLNEIKTDTNGNVYLSGATLWQNLGDVGTAFPNFTLPNISGNNIKSNVYVVKLNTYGQKVWATYIPSQNYTHFEINNGSVYVVTNDEINDNEANLATSGTFQQVKSSTAITRLNASNGTRVWGTYYGHNLYDAVISKIAVNENGIYIVGGAYNYSGTIGTYYSTQGAFQTQFAGGESDYFFAKFDFNGNRVWGTYYGTPAEEYILGGTSDLSLYGNKILYSYLQSGTFNHATPGAYLSVKPNNGYDIAFTMFNDEGARIFTSYYGGAIPINNVLGWTVNSKFADNEDSFFIFGSTSSQNGYNTLGTLQQNIIYPNTNFVGVSSFLAKFSLKSLSTSEVSISSDLQLFDNPNNGVFSLKGKILEKENCSFKIYDLTGRFLKEEKLGKENLQRFNYKGFLKSGNYILSVLDSKNVLIKTFKMMVR